ncbi:YbaB/EbfC family nucleoid-associated protein [Saccharothrix luteola]|uniref:YbaB/EbfC family nucleoid-associated protein n=1 Tax=Saccharothrix luteola TaxID=2893018 RepID=UPI001E50E5EA|nr:YbaB/EbfC family nucleoid-associated protein [Saccharothrix luteola]MCC8246415.1 YbaB/EbfC family nucleoid-associated protein [Saccharothrix luteola]
MTSPPPTIGDGLDLQAWRRTLLALREHVRTTTATAHSDDGLVTATAGGLGQLLDLRLHPRVHRTTDSRLLAARITETARAAADQARAHVAARLDALLAEREPRP